MASLQKVVNVSIDRGKRKLTFDPPEEIQLGAGEWIQWAFKDLLDSERGFISFAPPLPRLGPFHSMRTFDHSYVFGKGNKGSAGTFAYTAMVLDGDDPNPVATGTATIVSTALVPSAAPEIVVTYHPGDPKNPADPPRLEISPDPIALNTGDTVTWRFVGLPEDAFACFKFHPGDAGLNPALGPFVAFGASGDSSRGIEARGTGFVEALVDPPKQFSYELELRNRKGECLAVHDPVIDNLGPPPTNP